MTRHINDAGRQLIKSFESLRMRAYPDPATGGSPWTIGWGHTCGVKSGDSCSLASAERYLNADLATFEAGVSDLVHVPITDNQFSALVCLAFNIGLGNLRGSTLLRKLNIRDYAGAAAEFLRWDKAAGKQLAGLARRRSAERDLFLRSE